MAVFPPLTHVALSVPNLSVSVARYEALFDVEPVIDEDTDLDFHHTVHLIGNGTLIGLHQHKVSGAFSPIDHAANGSYS